MDTRRIIAALGCAALPFVGGCSDAGTPGASGGSVGGNGSPVASGSSGRSGASAGSGQATPGPATSSHAPLPTVADYAAQLQNAHPELQDGRLAWSATTGAAAPTRVTIPPNTVLDVHVVCRGGGGVEIRGDDGPRRAFLLGTDGCAAGLDYAGKKPMGPARTTVTLGVRSGPGIEFTAVGFLTPAAGGTGSR